MFYLSEKEFREKMRKTRLKNAEIARRQELEKEKNKYKPTKKKIQTSKIFFILLFLSCFATQIFSMVAMWHFADLSSLSVLIGSTLTEGVGLMGYYLKAFMESKEEEKLKFEREKFYAESHNDDEAVG